MYIGVGESKFDEMVADGRMPKSFPIDGRRVWDVRKLDLAFDALPTDDDCDLGGWEDFDANPKEGA
jgi:hypothetical protein